MGEPRTAAGVVAARTEWIEDHKANGDHRVAAVASFIHKYYDATSRHNSAVREAAQALWPLHD